jgi:hypothetical protein
MSTPKDNSAAEARAAEDRRQAQIAAGTTQVNDIFSKFDDNYYGGVQKASDDFYMPQVDDQYEEARRKMVLTLGGSGRLNGSSGARDLGTLDERYRTQRADLANRGISTANDYRTDVERNRSEVLNQLNASANPASAAATANARAQSLTAPPTFSAIGNLFTDLLSSAGTGLAIEASGRGPGFGTGIFSPGTSRAGSLKVVN